MARLLVATLLVICLGYASAASYGKPSRRGSCLCGSDGKGIETWERPCVPDPAGQCPYPIETWDVVCDCGGIDLSTEEIVGIVMGSVVFLLLIVILISWLCCCCGCCGKNDTTCCGGPGAEDGMDGGCMGCGCNPPDDDPAYGGKPVRGPIMTRPQPQVLVTAQQPTFAPAVVQQPQLSYVVQ